MVRVHSTLPCLTERKSEAQTYQTSGYWHSQVLNLWMAGLSFFSNIKLPYTYCILVGQIIQSFQDKNHLFSYPHLAMTNKSSV